MSTHTTAPIDMALNHGTYCSERALEVLRRYSDTTSLRHYAREDDGELSAAIGAWAELPTASVLVSNGSGPLLKGCIPHLIEQRIRSSPVRIAKHLLLRRGYPLIVTSPTYSKVPPAAAKLKLSFETVELDPAKGFALDLDALRAVLRSTDGLVYVCTPNNPTGNMLLDRAGLESLLAEFPRSFFFIDEVYADYVAPERRPRFADLVLRHDNLLLLRSFSFAFGLAAAHVGCALTNPRLVEEFRAKLTPFLVAKLNAELVMAALSDPHHLPRVRAEMAAERTRMIAGLRALGTIEPFESETNFVYARLTNGTRAKELAAGILSLGMVLKTFEPIGERRFDEWFRITVGLPAENRRLLELLGKHFEGATKRAAVG